MKRFFTSLATFSLAETFGRHPVIAGVLSLLGVGGGTAIATNLITPTLLPFVSANFNPNQSIGTTNNGLRPNGGVDGAMRLPAAATNSAIYYGEIVLDPNLGYAATFQSLFGGMFVGGNANPGQPNIFFQKTVAGISGSQWWLNPGSSVTITSSGNTLGSNYATGLFPISGLSGTGCTRPPTAVWQPSSGSLKTVDPGFGCPAATFSLNSAAIVANVPGSGAQQATGLAASLGATTCVSNSPVSGEMKVTANLAVAHGITPGQQYTLQGFSGTGFTGYNATYVALPGTTGSTLVGETATGGGTCPTSPLDTSGHEGTALNGTGAALNFPTVSATAPYGSGSMGITLRNNQHACFIMGEYGDDSPFPGAQFMSIVDEKGNALSGSPALVTTPNQASENFNGYTVSTGNTSTLTVTLPLKAYTITSAAWALGSGNLAATGLVTFQVSTNPGFIPGSEFTVSGMSPSSVNGTYIAVAGTSSSQIVGNQLTGPNGIPQAYANPGAITTASTPQMVSVILPGQTILGATPNPTYILPYGTVANGSATTGTGADGTYALSSAQTAALGSSGSPAVIFTFSSFYYSAATSGNPAGGVVTARSPGAMGDMLGLFGTNTNIVNGAQKNGWGGALGNIADLVGVMPMQTGSAPSTAALASICTKQKDIQKYASDNGLKVQALYRLNDLGIFGDSSDATITGYLSAASGTSGGTATLNVVSTTFGSLALATGTQTANLTGVGLPVAAPVTIPLTTSAGSTYTVTFPAGVTSANLGSSGAPVTFAVGAWKPALPIASSTFKGYIDTTSGVSTLHVTTLDDGSTHSGFASGTGTLGTTFTASIVPGTGSNGAASGHGLLTVTAVPSGSGAPPLNAVIGIGTVVSPPVSNSGAFTQTTVLGYATSPATPGQGQVGSYEVDVSQTVSAQSMYGSGILPGPATALQWTASTGTPAQGMAVTDGGASLTGSPLLVTGVSGSTPNYVLTVVGNYYPPISADATMQASLSTIVPGEYIQNAAITNPVKIVGVGAGGLAPGNYTLSGAPNAVSTCGGVGCVGTSGSPVVFTGTTITDGGAIAPGPALHIDDRGPAITFKLDPSFSSKTGTIRLTGTYDVATLGGTPTGIQALVSNSANGPALAGCTPCNWGAMTATIAGGNWSGTISGIPGGGPYFVSVRATNGTAYATLPNSVKVGLSYALWGQGQADAIQAAQAGSWISYFSGLWGYFNWNTSYSSVETYLQGPPILGTFVPGQPGAVAGDRFGVTGGAPLSEGFGAFDQTLGNSLGVPVSFLSPTHDGVGIGISTLGNVAQTQTIGVGDGSSLTWCSSSKLCTDPTGGAQSTLVFNAAALTGVWFNGSVSGSTLTVTTRYGGALMPGMVLGATGSPKVLRCLTSCTTPLSIDGSTWALSSSAANGATGTLAAPLRADPASTQIPFGGTTTPWPNLNIQTNGSAVYAFVGYGAPLVKQGTFKIIDTDATGVATTLCQDSQVFAYNNTGGNCVAIGGASPAVAIAFVNYQTGDYQVTFSTAPVSGHSITASWINNISPEPINSVVLSRVQNLDMFGDGTCQSGADSAMFCKAPGGVNGHIFSGEGTDKGYMMGLNAPAFSGYQYGGIGYSQMVSHLYGAKFPYLVPGADPAVAFITTGQWRVEGPSVFTNPPGSLDGVHDQWTQDVVTKSTFSGTVSGAVLTLTSAATGPMWEGEILGCVTYNASTCPIGPLSGTYITSLASGAWGASASTYNLSNSPGNLTAQPLQNPVYYSGAGPAFYAGTLNDIIVQVSNLSNTVGRNPHPSNGFTGGRRAASRWAAMINGANGGAASDPKVDRVKANTTGCDAASIASPCLDVGTTYQASHSATWSGNIVTVTGGLSAHARPFVVGQAVSCASCNSNLVITSLSVPPTQSTVTGAGEVGQTFTFTVQNASGQAIGGSGTGTITAGCSGTSGTGSNCIDVSVAINVSGTFGTAAAIATCGANNLNGNSPNYVIPTGKCKDNGIGELVRAFRVGTNQLMFGNGSFGPTAGSVFDDGVDLANGAFNQNAAFTANIVGAKTVQLVKAPAYSSGVLTGVGSWAAPVAGVPQTFVTYGDLIVVSGRYASLLGYVGGQSFPITSGGTGYSNQTVTATCGTIQSGGTAPRFDIWTSGGVIVSVVPSAATTGNVPAGLGVGSTCTVTPTGGSGASIPAIAVAPLEGVGGIGTYNTDSNTMGMFLYDNSGFSGNPLHAFFQDGPGTGYFEPGLPLRPFGEFQGAAVSG